MILLDDAQSTAAKPSSRLYRNPLHYWCALPSGNRTQDQLVIENCLEEISTSLSRGEFVVAAFAYELGRLIHQLPERSDTTASDHPLIEAWSFSNYEKLSKQAVDDFISDQLAQIEPNQRMAGIMDVQQSLSEAQFAQDIETIQEYIRSGDTYQINHTYRITGKTYGTPLALYSQLRARQPGRYGAFIAQHPRYLLSQSPELFISRKGDTLEAMPMKGTASALSEKASALSDDPKNQAENVMIVDLLRNDLSRIALPGSVTVPKLFEVARHGDVLQMTSTVQGKIKPHTTLHEILKAVFPCGSVTGAPKKRSMEIIQELEPTDRGYYCGALGWLDPNQDFAFSVPIRTIEITENAITKDKHFNLGVGAGITIDSDTHLEWQECRIKAAFLTELPSACGLFETILVRQGKPQAVVAHLERMQSSALALGIPFDLSAAQGSIDKACIPLGDHLNYRLRLDLAPDGAFSFTIAPLEEISQPVKLFWAKDILSENVQMHSGNPLLRHKISQRTLYDQAWKKALALGGFDAIFTNEHGFVTEGGRTSIFIKSSGIDGVDMWLTPPLSAGLLPGVMRSTLLTDPNFNAREANLTIQDVCSADEIILTNALRGAIKAYF